MRAVFAGVALLSVLALGSASAASLGSFNEPVLDGYVDDVAVCTGTVTLSSLAVPLVIPALSPLPIIDSVAIDGLSGDCDGLTPVVVVIGTGALGPSDYVLATETFTAPVPTGASSMAQPSSFGLLALGLFDPTATILELRLGFCPVGAAGCLP